MYRNIQRVLNGETLECITTCESPIKQSVRKWLEDQRDIKSKKYTGYKSVFRGALHIDDILVHMSEGKMDTAVDYIKHISANTDSIIDNTERTAQYTEQVAYYTEKTAQYSKINAELTNALGFMAALK